MVMRMSASSLGKDLACKKSLNRNPPSIKSNPPPTHIRRIFKEGQADKRFPSYCVKTSTIFLRKKGQNRVSNDQIKESIKMLANIHHCFRTNCQIKVIRFIG